MNQILNPTTGQVTVYEANDGNVHVDVQIKRETVWLAQGQMAELFGTSTGNVGLHLRNIHADQELLENATIEEFSVVQYEGTSKAKRSIRHYNFDALISVGDRTNFKREVVYANGPLAHCANSRCLDLRVTSNAILKASSISPTHHLH